VGTPKFSAEAGCSGEPKSSNPIFALMAERELTMLAKNWKCVVACAALGIVLSMTDTVKATVVVGEQTSMTESEYWLNQGGIIALTNDLANSNQATFGSLSVSVAGAYDSNPAYLVDGSIWSGLPASYTSTGYGVGTGVTPTSGTITIMFNTSVNTAGYDLTGFDTITGEYYHPNDGQQYTVQVQKVGSSSWASIPGVGAVASNGVDSIVREMKVYDDGGAVLTSGVQGIRFNLTPTENFEMYHEIDVVGTPTTIAPEPSTLALLAAGLVGLLAYAWRKRR
jgi:hypothetical protein